MLTTASPCSERISAVDAAPDPFASPLGIALPDGGQAVLKIDLVTQARGICALGGWRSQPLGMAVERDGKRLAIMAQCQFERADVTKHLGRIGEHGFALAFACASPGSYELILDCGLRFALSPLSAPAWDGNAGVLGAEMAEFLRARNQIRAGASDVRAAIDCALRWPDAAFDNPVIMAGWLAGAAEICLGNEEHLRRPELHFFMRPDIAADHDLAIPKDIRGQGFICVLKDYPRECGEIGLFAHSGADAVRLCRHKIADFSGFRALLKAIFEIDMPNWQIARIYGDALAPLLMPLARRRAEIILAAEHGEKIVGKVAAKPAASVIIPIYGTIDYFERQVERFALDGAFAEMAEIVYVIDDLRLLDAFILRATALCRRHGTGVRVVWAQVSQGYAGACNLGARAAHGDYLVFMNSDVWPLRPRWLEEFASFLARNPRAGIAGASLYYPDGRPQSLGARLRHDAALDIYECAHLLDEADAPRIAAFVIGACIAMRARDFQAVNGFDPAYLIGNSEDLDLCAKIKSKGLDIFLLPSITMAHARHKSFEKMEQGKWLDRLYMYNAVVLKNRFCSVGRDGCRDVRA